MSKKQTSNKKTAPTTKNVSSTAKFDPYKMYPYPTSETESIPDDLKLMQVVKQNENYGRWFWSGSKLDPRFFRFADGKPSLVPGPSPAPKKRIIETVEEEEVESPQVQVRTYNLPSYTAPTNDEVKDKLTKLISNVNRQHNLLMENLNSRLEITETNNTEVLHELKKYSSGVNEQFHMMMNMMEKLNVRMYNLEQSLSQTPNKLSTKKKTTTTEPVPHEAEWIDTKRSLDNKKKKKKSMKKVIPATPPSREEKDAVSSEDLMIEVEAKDDNDVISILRNSK